MISYQIRDLREDAELTQEHIAETLHMHRTTYARYETVEREVPFNITILLAQYYNASLDYLANLTSEKGFCPNHFIKKRNIKA